MKGYRIVLPLLLAADFPSFCSSLIPSYYLRLTYQPSPPPFHLFPPLTPPSARLSDSQCLHAQGKGFSLSPSQPFFSPVGEPQIALETSSSPLLLSHTASLFIQ